jgi:hypothetical protein
MKEREFFSLLLSIAGLSGHFPELSTITGAFLHWIAGEQKMNGPFRPGSVKTSHILVNDQTGSQTQGAKKMSKINRNHVFTAAAALGAAAIFSMLSFGGSAEASTSVASCRGPTAAKVASCCEEITEKKGRPLWMLQTGKN